MSTAVYQLQMDSAVNDKQTLTMLPEICVTPPVDHEHMTGSTKHPLDYTLLPSTLQARYLNKDLNVFPLPEVLEEESTVEPPTTSTTNPAKDFRARAGSGGLKGLLSNFKRSRNKSGDSQISAASDSSQYSNQPSTNGEGTPEKASKSGIKSFLFRARSQSDAAAVKSAMLRRRHISQGSSPQQYNNAAIQPDMLNNNHEPVMRSRSTSWGAKEKLAMSKQMKITGGSPGQGGQTPMSQLIGGGGVPINRKVERHKARMRSHSLATNSLLSPGIGDHFTGKAFIWQRAASVDESSRRQWNTADVMETEFEDLVKGDPEIFNKFMRAHKCYDLIPTSAKLIVFDTQLSVKKAFYALVYNCVRAAPLWDSAKQDFVGMLTISDFILILNHYYQSPTSTMNDLEEHRIATWRKVLPHKYTNLISISPDASLHEAVLLLLRTKVHRLPIVDPATGNALYILTHKRVLKFLYLFMRNLPQPSYMDQSLDELKIGTFYNVATVSKDSRLIDALSKFTNRRVSALPVVNELNQVVDIYAKFDVINLAADKSYNNLEVSIAHALGMRKTPTETVHTCVRTDQLKVVVEKLVKTEVHRLIIVDNNNKLDGVVSLSDILNYLVKEDRHLSDSFSGVSCSAAAGDEMMDLFPAEPLEAV